MIRSTCPNCGAIWGTEEMDWNDCFSCGYPDCEDETDEFDDEIETTEESDF